MLFIDHVVLITPVWKNEMINYLKLFFDTSNENAIIRFQELLNVEVHEVVMAAIL